MIGNVNVPGALAADIANKVDKVIGKGLSSNDFTDAYKTQLDEMSQSSTGGTKSTIVCSMTQPQDLKNGLWIKTDDNSKDLKIINENRIQSEIIYYKNDIVDCAAYAHSTNGIVYLFRKNSDEIYKLNITNGFIKKCKAKTPLFNNGDYIRQSTAQYSPINNCIYLFSILDNRNSDKNNIYKYNISEDKLTTLDILIPKGYLATSCAIDDKIYIFGTGRVDVYCFDVTTETLTILIEKSSIFPESYTNKYCCVVDGKIYLFGGSRSINQQTYCINNIYCFDPTNNTLVNKNATLPNYMYDIACNGFGNKIYLFGGHYRYLNGNNGKYYDTYYDTIYCYDITNDTIADTGFTLDTLSTSLAAPYVSNNKIYLFGGYDDNSRFKPNIYKFELNNGISYVTEKLPNTTANCCAVSDIDNNYTYLFINGNKIYKRDEDGNYTELTTTLASNTQPTSCCNINDKIYIFGDNSTNIQCFDIHNNTCTTLSAVFPYNITDSSCCSIDDTIYILDARSGGLFSYNVTTNDITKIKISIDGSFSSGCICEYNKKIYIFNSSARNSNYGVSSSYLYCYDTISNDYTEILKMASGSNSFYGNYSTCIRCGHYIYLFGGLSFNSSNDRTGKLSNYISRFDPVDNSLSICNTTLPIQLCNSYACIFRGRVYLFGGNLNVINSQDNNPRLNLPSYNVFSFIIDYGNEISNNEDTILITESDPTKKNNYNVALEMVQNKSYKYSTISSVDMITSFDIDDNYHGYHKNLEWYKIENYKIQ